MLNKDLLNKKKGYIDNKNDIKSFEKAFMQNGSNHLFGVHNNVPIGFSYKSDIGSNVMFFGSDLTDKHNYEKYIIHNLKQNNCSNIVVTREPLRYEQGDVHFDYVINFDTYNPLNYLYQLYKRENEVSYFTNLDTLCHYIDEDKMPFGSDPFRPHLCKTLLSLLICYVIENGTIENKDFNSVLELLQNFRTKNSTFACSEEIANGKSPSLNELRLFYENSSEKWGKSYFDTLNVMTCRTKTLSDEIINLAIKLQSFRNHCNNTIDFDELIKEQKNILIKLPISCEVPRLYKIFFSQYLMHRFNYVERNATFLNDIPYTQIYLDEVASWDIIECLDMVLACDRKCRIGMSLYCDDIDLAERKYDTKTGQTFLENCGVKIFPIKNARQSTISLLRKEAQKSNLKFISFDKVIPDADIQKFAENNKQIVLFGELVPIICDYFA